MITRKDASKLAVAYAAYLAAVERGDGSAVLVWGPMLSRLQEALQIELAAPSVIAALVALARRSSASEFRTATLASFRAVAA